MSDVPLVRAVSLMDLAAVSGLSPSTIRYWIVSGRLGAFKERLKAPIPATRYDKGVWWIPISEAISVTFDRVEDFVGFDDSIINQLRPAPDYVRVPPQFIDSDVLELLNDWSND